MKRNFENDLASSQVYERKAINFFKKKYPDLKLNYPTGYHPQFDFAFGDIQVEVKADFHQKQLVDDPNLVIETWCNGKLSGLGHTTAKYLCYFFTLKNQMIVIKVDELRQYMINNTPNRITYRNSDNGKAAGFLIKLKNIQEKGICRIYNYR